MQAKNEIVKGVFKKNWALAFGILGLTSVASAAILLPNLFPFLDSTGIVSTYNTGGPIDESTNNPFFQSMGTNGRTCGTCHLASDAFGLSSRSIQATYQRTHGSDPLFAEVDGANCPGTTPSDPASHSLLLKNGLIRISLQVPANAPFKIQAYQDPYGCAVVTDRRRGCKQFRFTVVLCRRPTFAI